MNRTTQLAKLTADRAWKRWADTQLRKRKFSDAELESRGSYLGYDADTGLHQIELLSGQVIDAESITTGGQSEGDAVVIAGGRFKAMPR